MTYQPRKIEASYEARLVRHYSANRKRVMNPANAVDKKAPVVVRAQVRVPPCDFIAARCQDLGVTVEDVRSTSHSKAMAPIRQQLWFEVRQEYPALKKEALGRLFNRSSKSISGAIEKMRAKA